MLQYYRNSQNYYKTQNKRNWNQINPIIKLFPVALKDNQIPKVKSVLYDRAVNLFSAPSCVK